MENIIHNLGVIHERINRACKKANRDANEVRLLMATKTVTAENINVALAQGEKLIGENKVQELAQKGAAVKVHNPEVHFIGHLQSNKIKEVIKWASCIQSIDRLSLAQKLQDRLAFEQREIDVYIQVNTSFEESKFGVAPSDAVELVQAVAQLENINIKGLMTIGVLSDTSKEIRKYFHLLKNIQQEIIALNIPRVAMNELSMGMSGDLEIAIEEGATIVRVGTAIFGERIYPDSYYWDERGV